MLSLAARTTSAGSAGVQNVTYYTRSIVRSMPVGRGALGRREDARLGARSGGQERSLLRGWKVGRRWGSDRGGLGEGGWGMGPDLGGSGHRLDCGAQRSDNWDWNRTMSTEPIEDPVFLVSIVSERERRSRPGAGELTGAHACSKGWRRSWVR